MFNSEVDFCWDQLQTKNGRFKTVNLPGTHFSQVSAIGLHTEVAGRNFMAYDIQEI